MPEVRVPNILRVSDWLFKVVVAGVFREAARLLASDLVLAAWSLATPVTGEF